MLQSLHAECHYTKCHYARRRYAERHYAERRYAERRYAQCLGTIPNFLPFQRRHLAAIRQNAFPRRRRWTAIS